MLVYGFVGLNLWLHSHDLGLGLAELPLTILDLFFSHYQSSREDFIVGHFGGCVDIAAGIHDFWYYFVKNPRFEFFGAGQLRPCRQPHNVALGDDNSNIAATTASITFCDTDILCMFTVF